jgi:cysteine-rich repeat protein
MGATARCEVGNRRLSRSAIGVCVLVWGLLSVIGPVRHTRADSPDEAWRGSCHKPGSADGHLPEADCECPHTYPTCDCPRASCTAKAPAACGLPAFPDDPDNSANEEFCPGECWFSIVALPDTQTLVRYDTPDDARTFDCQTEWIKANKDRLNVAFVLHVGDVVQNDTSDEQWARAKKSMCVLHDAVPYFVSLGNHDISQKTLADEYFPPSLFSARVSATGEACQPGETCSRRADRMDYMYRVFSGQNVCNLGHDWSDDPVTPFVEHQAQTRTNGAAPVWAMFSNFQWVDRTDQRVGTLVVANVCPKLGKVRVRHYSPWTGNCYVGNSSFGYMLDTTNGIDFSLKCGDGVHGENAQHQTEQCDDGNADNTDCCSTSCTPVAAAGTPCESDGNPCTTQGTCNGSGFCNETFCNVGGPCGAGCSSQCYQYGPTCYCP